MSSTFWRRVIPATLAIIGAGAGPAPGRAGVTSPPQPLVIRGATLLTVTRGVIPGGTLVIQDGKIASAGKDVPIPAGAHVIEAQGKFVLPGIVDTHSHIGVYPWPGAAAHDDGNEATDPLTPHVRAEDSVFLEDPALERARAGGVTTMQVIPGSANLAGGMAVVLKLRPVNTLAEMKLDGAPPGIKMAFGENPKRVYGHRDRIPSTRMGNAALVREAFMRAREYQAKWEDYEKNRNTAHPLPRPDRDPKLDTLVEVLKGSIRVHVHCYRKDDLLAVMRIADEFAFKIAAFHHVLEGYKLADELARRDIGACTWADWWGFKMEAWDGIPENAALMARKGVRVAIHSDSAEGIQHLYHEAAKAVRHGMTEEQGLKSITLWPASILGLDKRIGSLDEGKDADVAVFARHPFDVYTRVDLTLVDGRIVFDREKGGTE
jgi:imidazolonepropionase-like amidohydrolase